MSGSEFVTLRDKLKEKLTIPTLGLIVSLLLLLLAQREALAELFASWQTEEYSHGIVIPIISLLIGWHRLSERKPTILPSWWGIVWLGFAAFLELISQLSAFNATAEYGLIAGFVGLFLAFFGKEASYAVSPAFIYLLFAIPLPHLIQADLSQKLQLLSSTIGVYFLDLLNYTVFQEGNVIDLGGMKLQVVDACSGLRYLFPMMSFSYLIAFLLKDRYWKRAVIFLSAIPITIVLNSLRITFIGITVNQWGREMAEGLIHSAEGWSVFGICIVLLLIETSILKRIGTKGRFQYNYFGIARGKLFKGEEKRPKPMLFSFLTVCLLAAIFGTGLIENRYEITPPHRLLPSFPLQVSEWEGKMQNMPQDVLNELKLSDYILAEYSKAGTQEPSINFYIAYYASQRLGATTHSPSNCIPGGGWQIDSSKVISVPLKGTEPLHLTRLIIRRGEASQLVYYWFDERGRIFTETYNAKFYLMLDSILMHRTDGSLIRLVTEIRKGEKEESADKRLGTFIEAVYPQIRQFIPGSAMP